MNKNKREETEQVIFTVRRISESLSHPTHCEVLFFNVPEEATQLLEPAVQQAFSL